MLAWRDHPAALEMTKEIDGHILCKTQQATASWKLPSLDV